MRETREVTLTLRLPLDIAAGAEEVQKTDPEFLERVVLYGLTRRSIYRHLQEQRQEGTLDGHHAKIERIDADGEATVVAEGTLRVREGSLELQDDDVQPIPKEKGRAILAENRQRAIELKG